jgi:hypothetical protein
MTQRAWVALLAASALLVGCGGDTPAERPVGGSVAEAKRQSRPIGGPERFHAPAPLRRVPGCRRSLGRRNGAHVELFAEDRVVVVPAGIGTLPPRRHEFGRIVAARCYGPLVTLEPTGVVLVRPGTRTTVGDLFRQWGVPLTPRRFGPFTAPGGGRVRAYVAGRRWHGAPAAIPLSDHAAIVLEVGPYVPPHRFFLFPRGI